LFQREHDVPALAATVEVAGRTLSILDVHALPPIGKLMAGHRNRHLQSIRNWFEEQSGPAVLLGDLNLTMFSPEYRRFTQGMDLRNARQGFGPQGTWPTWVPFARLPLDQCLLRGDIGVTSFATGPDIGSDHLPIIIDLFVAPAWRDDASARVNAPRRQSATILDRYFRAASPSRSIARAIDFNAVIRHKDRRDEIFFSDARRASMTPIDASSARWAPLSKVATPRWWCARMRQKWRDWIVFSPVFTRVKCTIDPVEKSRRIAAAARC
jgi:hypothetical protein